MNELSRKDNYFPALDGLRGIAILLVVFYHNYDFIDQFTFGWLGVDIFFVLSGYLITGILISTLGRQGYLKNFYTRRMLRIFPLYYAILIIFLVVFPLLGFYKQELQYYLNNQLWLWIYLQNWLYSFNLPVNNSVLNHLWSLAVEEQFYLVWPLLILLIRNTRTLFFLMLFILLAVISARGILYLLKLPKFNYIAFYTFTRIDGLCIGSMIALLHKINFTFLSRYLAIIITVLACFNFAFYFLTFQNSKAYPYYAIVGYTTFAGLFGVLVHELVSTSHSFLNKCFSFAPLRFLGKISYGLYIFHWPIYLLLTPAVARLIGPFINLPLKLERTLYSSVVTLVAIVVSIISYYTFEMKFLKLKEKFR